MRLSDNQLHHRDKLGNQNNDLKLHHLDKLRNQNNDLNIVKEKVKISSV